MTNNLPDRGQASVPGHGSQSSPDPGFYSGRGAGALESALEDPRPGPSYVVVNGHLPDCPYLRALQWNEEDGVECDCHDRDLGDNEIDEDGDDD